MKKLVRSLITVASLLSMIHAVTSAAPAPVKRARHDQAQIRRGTPVVDPSLLERQTRLLARIDEAGVLYGAIDMKIGATPQVKRVSDAISKLKEFAQAIRSKQSTEKDFLNGSFPWCQGNPLNLQQLSVAQDITEAYLEYALIFGREFKSGATSGYIDKKEIEKAIQVYVPALFMNKVAQTWFTPDYAPPDIDRELGPLGRVYLGQRGLLTGQGYPEGTSKEVKQKHSLESFFRLTDDITKN